MIARGSPTVDAISSMVVYAIVYDPAAVTTTIDADTVSVVVCIATFDVAIIRILEGK